jgi:hypothetical protein
MVSGSSTKGVYAGLNIDILYNFTYINNGSSQSITTGTLNNTGYTIYSPTFSPDNTKLVIAGY